MIPAPHPGIDTTANLTPHLPMLAASGVRYASRYLRSAGLKRPEANAIRAAGINLILNYEGRGDDINAFDAAKGTRDATYAMSEAKLLGAPVGTAIYFSCEPSNYNNLTSTYRDRVAPYWRSVNAVLSGTYRIGAYTFGTWLDWLLRDNLTTFCWLPNATGWPGYRAFLESNRWHYLQHAPGNVNFNGLLVDWDTPNPTFADIGAWMADAPGRVIPVDLGNVQWPTIRIGARGEAIRHLQTLLGIAVDGIFGRLTDHSVRNFQTTHGLTVDGIVGPKTWAKLEGK